jgi:hypothetical protein
MSPMSSALADVIGGGWFAPTTGYLESMRGVSRESQRREKEFVRMFYADSGRWWRGDEVMMQGILNGWAELFLSHATNF